MGNIELACKDCFDDKHKQFQETFDPLMLKVGDDVKKRFTDGENVEHMWVLITKLNKKSITGTLNNIPVDLKNIKLHDIVNVKHTEIEQLT